MKKVIAAIIALYIALSAAATIMWHAYPEQSWHIATHRHGLLIFDCEKNCLWVTNPFTAYGDDWVLVYEY